MAFPDRGTGDAPDREPRNAMTALGMGRDGGQMPCQAGLAR